MADSENYILRSLSATKPNSLISRLRQNRQFRAVRTILLEVLWFRLRIRIRSRIWSALRSSAWSRCSLRTTSRTAASSMRCGTSWNVEFTQAQLQLTDLRSLNRENSIRPHTATNLVFYSNPFPILHHHSKKLREIHINAHKNWPASRGDSSTVHSLSSLKVLS